MVNAYDIKLLIADDDEQIRTGIQEGIDWESLGISTVSTAASGTSALEIFSEVLPDIVIADIRMPGMDGLALLQKIKELKKEARVIILSAYAEFDYAKKALQYGASDYEVKPIRLRKLIDLVQKSKDEILRERISEAQFSRYMNSYRSTFVESLLKGRTSDPSVILTDLKKCFNFDGTGLLLIAVAQIDNFWRFESEAAIDSTEQVINFFYGQLQASK